MKCLLSLNLKEDRMRIGFIPENENDELLLDLLIQGRWMRGSEREEERAVVGFEK